MKVLSMPRNGMNSKPLLDNTGAKEEKFAGGIVCAFPLTPPGGPGKTVSSSGLLKKSQSTRIHCVHEHLWNDIF